MSFGLIQARHLLYTLPHNSQLNLNLSTVQHLRLVQHSELVLEAAESLLHDLVPLLENEASSLSANANHRINEQHVRAGTLLHDVGKALHPNELTGSGNLHEVSGYNLCLNLGVPASLARCCITHGQWRRWFDEVNDSGALVGNSEFEWPITANDLVIALADTLWKGVRCELLESLVIDAVAVGVNIQRDYGVVHRISHAGSQSESLPTSTSPHRKHLNEQSSQAISQQERVNYWRLVMQLDELFESVANLGDERLARSQTTDAVDLAVLDKAC